MEKSLKQISISTSAHEHTYTTYLKLSDGDRSISINDHGDGFSKLKNAISQLTDNPFTEQELIVLDRTFHKLIGKFFPIFNDDGTATWNFRTSTGDIQSVTGHSYYEYRVISVDNIQNGVRIPDLNFEDVLTRKNLDINQSVIEKLFDLLSNNMEIDVDNSHCTFFDNPDLTFNCEVDYQDNDSAMHILPYPYPIETL